VGPGKVYFGSDTPAAVCRPPQIWRLLILLNKGQRSLDWAGVEQVGAFRQLDQESIAYFGGHRVNEWLQLVCWFPFADEFEAGGAVPAVPIPQCEPTMFGSRGVSPEDGHQVLSFRGIQCAFGRPSTIPWNRTCRAMGWQCDVMELYVVGNGRLTPRG